MTAVTILYTTSDKIRACIGCDEQDLPDDVVLNKDLDLLMLERLDTVYPTHEDDVDADEVLERRLKLWCMYFGALTILEDSTLSIAQKIQSNTDQLVRFNTDFELLKTELRRKLQDLETAINATLAPATFNLVGAATPDYDPIIGPQ